MKRKIKGVGGVFFVIVTMLAVCIIMVILQFSRMSLALSIQNSIL